MTCARCGKANPTEAKFCLECGSPLAGVAPGMREERRVVTVLFADLVGFTSQAEHLDPEEVRAILQPYHASVRTDLERYGGTVEKFIGDAVMALFGAPVAHDDDPERAVRAALTIRDTLASDGRLHVRIGITTGEALVVLEAPPGSGEGMAAGDVVNTAARLQGVAPVDGILVDEKTFRATARAIEYREHEPVAVKGRIQPVAVREVMSARAGFGVDVRQIGRSPLVGRRREIQLLTDALARARTEREPQLVTLVGVPGIGKSRIVWEMFKQIDAGTELVAWRQGRSLPYAEGISFWALGEIVKAEAGILDTDSADEAGAKLSRAIGALAEQRSDADWIERHLRPLVGLETAVELRGDHRGDAFAAWRRFLEALADRRPLALIFEDLHWADDGLLDFIDHLVDWVAGVPLLIVATSRPELLTRRPGWGGGKPNALTASLAPLSDAETRSLVSTVVERALIPEAARDAVLERAQGNPLYAEEFARLVIERGRLDDLPESVQGIIAARLDTLSRDEKEVLRHAAIVGKVFWSGAVAQMSRRSRSDVDAHLHALERREFVRRERRSSVADETEYAFRHILIRDVAYGQIPRGDRADDHAAAADWIESLGRPADHAEQLAQHYLSAIDLARAAGRPAQSYADRARGALRDAGARAMTLNAFAPAARYFGAALELMSRDDPDRPTALFQYGKARRIAEEAGGHELAEAETALRASGDFATAAEAAVLQAELAWVAGDGDMTSAHLERAARLVDDLQPSFSKAYVLSDLSRYHMLARRLDQAIDLGRQALDIAERLDIDEIRAHALNNVGSARAFSGDLAGIQDLEKALEIALATRSPEVPRALNNLAAWLEDTGDTKRAWPLLRDAHQRARELGNVPLARFTRARLPSIDFNEGSWDEALRSLDEFISEAEAGGGHTMEASSRAFRGRIRLARGDLPGAAEDAERGLAAGRRAGDPHGLVPALSFMGWLKARTGRQPEANPLIDEVIDQATPTPETNMTGAELALTLAALGRGRDLDRLVEQMRPTRFRGIFALIAAEKPGDAADACEEIGVLPYAALLRMAEAERLIAHGRGAEAQGQLARAVEFWRSVGATYFVKEAEALSARSDAGRPDNEHAPQR